MTERDLEQILSRLRDSDIPANVRLRSADEYIAAARSQRPLPFLTRARRWLRLHLGLVAVVSTVTVGGLATAGTLNTSRPAVAITTVSCFSTASLNGTQTVHLLTGPPADLCAADGGALRGPKITCLLSSGYLAVFPAATPAVTCASIGMAKCNGTFHLADDEKINGVLNKHPESFYCGTVATLTAHSQQLLIEAKVHGWKVAVTASSDPAHCYAPVPDLATKTLTETP